MRELLADGVELGRLRYVGFIISFSLLLQICELAIESIAGQAHLFHLMLVLALLLLQLVAVLGELSDLHLVAQRIADLPLRIAQHHPQRLDLRGQPLDFQGLEDDNKVQPARKVAPPVAGKMLDPRSEYCHAQLRTSSSAPSAVLSPLWVE